MSEFVDFMGLLDLMDLLDFMELVNFVDFTDLMELLCFVELRSWRDDFLLRDFLLREDTGGMSHSTVAGGLSEGNFKLVLEMGDICKLVDFLLQMSIRCDVY